MTKKTLIYKTTSLACMMGVLVMTNIATVEAYEVGLKNVTANIVDDSVIIAVDGNKDCYDSSYKVTLTPALSGASVHFTTNGENPTCGSTLYTAPFVLDKGTVTVKAVSCHDALRSLPVSKTVTVPTSACDDVDISFVGTASCDKDDFRVTMATSLPESSIYYTTNGVAPACSAGTKYAGSFPLATTSTVKAVACLGGFQSVASEKRIVVPTNECEKPKPVCESAILKLTRIYFAPDSAHRGKCENDNEWVEIHNPTNCEVSTSGWSICNTGTTASGGFSASCSNANYCDNIGNYMIPAGGHAIVAAKSSTWGYWSFPGSAIKIALGQKLGYDGLKNTGDKVMLKYKGSTVDYVSWSKQTTAGKICVNSGNSCSYADNFSNKDTGSESDAVILTNAVMKNEDGEEYVLKEDAAETSAEGAADADAISTAKQSPAAETAAEAPVLKTAVAADETVVLEAIAPETSASEIVVEMPALKQEAPVMKTAVVEPEVVAVEEEPAIVADADASITFNFNA